MPDTDTVPATVNRYLLPREHQVIVVHFHPAVTLGPIGLVAAGLIAAGAVSGIAKLSSAALLVIWLIWGLLALYMIGRVLRWFGDYFVVTAQRILLVKGLLSRDVVSVSNAQIASMRFRRSAMGRVLGYGEFIIESGRYLPVQRINFLPYPEQLYLEVYGLLYPEPE
jgi:hypothetical protein